MSLQGEAWYMITPTKGDIKNFKSFSEDEIKVYLAFLDDKLARWERGTEVELSDLFVNTTCAKICDWYYFLEQELVRRGLADIIIGTTP